MLVLKLSDIRGLVSMRDAINSAANVLADHSNRKATVPARRAITSDGGISLFMPGAVASQNALGIKVVSVFDANPAKGLSTITALVLLLDPETGSPVACLEGGYITALRTGAAAGVATEYLARSDSRTMLLIGAGAQAETQAQAVCAVRRIKRVDVFDIDEQVAGRFVNKMADSLGVDMRVVGDVNASVESADIVVCATTSKTPVFDGARVKEGTHINGVGSYRPDMQEIDESLVIRADKIVADSKQAVWEEAGDVMIPFEKGLITRDRIDAEVGDLVLGRAQGRNNAKEITIYKGVGMAALDLGLAQMVFERACALGRGLSVDLLA